MDFPGEKLVIRLWETLAEKGIGGLLRPWQIRREGRARTEVRAEEMVILGHAERLVETMRGDHALLPAPGSSAATPALPALPAATVGSVQAEEALRRLKEEIAQAVTAEAIRKEVNLAKTLLLTEETLAGDPQSPPDDKPEMDWLFRWRDAAMGVSEPELQRLWARVLAGEVKAPGSFSLRTMEFLRNLSQSEARSIEKLLRFAVNDVIYRGATEILDQEGVTLAFLLSMQDLGVLTGVEATGLQVVWGSLQKDMFLLTLISHSKMLGVSHPDSSRKLTVPMCSLSMVAKELVRLADLKPHVDYLRHLGKFAVQQGFTVLLGNFERESDGTIRYFDAEGIS